MADVELGELMLAVEARGERVGWDNSLPALWVCYDATNPTTGREYRFLQGPGLGSAGRRWRGPSPIRSGSYAAQVAIPRLALCVGPPAQALFGFALNLGFLPAGAPGSTARAVFLAKIRQPGFLGVAFESEGWYNDTLTGEEYQRLRTQGRGLPDVVGSTEVRQVIGVDVEGRAYCAQRRRGHPPTLDVVSAHDQTQPPTGVWDADTTLARTAALHLIRAVITGQEVPTGPTIRLGFGLGDFTTEETDDDRPDRPDTAQPAASDVA